MHFITINYHTFCHIVGLSCSSLLCLGDIWNCGGWIWQLSLFLLNRHNISSCLQYIIILIHWAQSMSAQECWVSLMFFVFLFNYRPLYYPVRKVPALYWNEKLKSADSVSKPLLDQQRWTVMVQVENPFWIYIFTFNCAYMTAVLQL